MQQLSGSDSFFLYVDKPGRHQHISMVNIYDQSTAEGGVVRFKTILDHIQERLGTSRIFRQRLVKVPFDLDYLYMCGAKLLTLSGMAPLVDHLTMSQVVTSYNGQLVIAPHSDRKLLPDPEVYTECIEQVFEELKAAAKE